MIKKVKKISWNIEEKGCFYKVKTEYVYSEMKLGEMIYMQQGDKYVAVDNETGDFWVEEFDTEEEAINWLSDKSIEPKE